MGRYSNPICTALFFSQHKREKLHFSFSFFFHERIDANDIILQNKFCQCRNSRVILELAYCLFISLMFIV